MKNVRKIFFDDMKHLLRNFFVLVIIAGVSVLPALYAWLNVYSNWDPYGNTQNLTLAAVSEDENYTTSDGTKANTGDQILANLKKNKAIHWVFPDTKAEAIEGVRSGKYYGAIIVPKNFTYSMYNIFTTDVDRPALAFYQNQKKNPVANKITDTVADTVLSTVNNQFIEVIAKTVFVDANEMAADIKSQGGVDKIVSRLTDLNTELQNYQNIIDQVVKSNAALTSAIGAASSDVSDAKKETGDESSALKNSAGSLNETKNTLSSYTAEVNTAMTDIKNRLANMSSTLSDSQIPNNIQNLSDAASQSSTDIGTIITELEALNQSESGPDNNENLSQLHQALNEMITNAKSVQNVLETITGSSAVSDFQSRANDAKNSAKSEAEQAGNELNSRLKEAANQAGEAAQASLSTLSASLDQARSGVQELQNQYNNHLVQLMNSALDTTGQTLSEASQLMSTMSNTLAGMGNVFGALEVTINAGDTSLSSTKNVLSALSERLTNTINQVNAAKEDDKVKVLMDTLSGDPTLYASFFSSPVNIKSTAIYPVKNYGSAVTPFYTCLAIWVGGLILTAVMKVRPDRKKYPGSTSAERFFGRFLTFLSLAELQTLVTVLGNLYIFKVQCLHPFRFWLACAITALTFTLLIYSLVVAFHDVGKAVAVVLIVIQIAGSSGTYPIELLPEFFRRVYIFFPFPYAINAMRECIGGMYGHNYEFYLLQLSVFILVALGIGLLVQKPLHALSHFMEKRMHDTEMM